MNDQDQPDQAQPPHVSDAMARRCDQEYTRLKYLNPTMPLREMWRPILEAALREQEAAEPSGYTLLGPSAKSIVNHPNHSNHSNVFVGNGRLKRTCVSCGAITDALAPCSGCNSLDA